MARPPHYYNINLKGKIPEIDLDARPFWRLYFTESNHPRFLILSEIDMRTEIGEPGDMTTDTTITASSFSDVSGRYIPTNLIDGDINSVWGVAPDMNINSWWQIEFPEPRNIKQMVVSVCSESSCNTGGACVGSCTGETARSWYVQKSVNGSDWEDVTYISGQTWTLGESKTYTF